MPVAIEIALKAAEQILEAAGRLVEQPRSKDVQFMLVRGSRGVLEGTMKVQVFFYFLFTVPQWICCLLVDTASVG